jgi:signal transduction histidine kinase
MRNTTTNIFFLYRLLKNVLRNSTSKIVLCLICFLFLEKAKAQTFPDSLVVDVSKVQSAELITNAVFYTTFKKNALPDNAIDQLDISKKIPGEYEKRLPLEITGKDVYIKFFATNSADTSVTFYFSPGMYCKKMELFQKPFADPKRMLSPIGNYAGGFTEVTLKSKEKILLVARLNYIMTTITTLSPAIVKRDFISYFSFRQDNKVKGIYVKLLNYITAGILLMMIFYSVAVYLQSYNIEFVYYAIYASCMALLLFLKSYLFGKATEFNYFFEGFFDFVIQMTGYYFYLLFFRKFLNTKQDHPFLDKVFMVSGWIVAASVGLFVALYFISGEFSVINLVENVTKQILLIISLIFIFYGLRKKDPLMNYLITGQLCLTFFSVISFLLLITSMRIADTPNSVFNDSLIYYQAGLVLELIFFMSGLSYKNKRDLIERIKERERLKLDNERKEFEKQVAILEAKQQERNRISADMHDELGSGVTAIRLMSEIVKTKMKENTLPEIEKISQSANELINKMNTIIWTMVSSNDSVESLVAYIRAYAVEFFENTPIECSFNLPTQISSKELSGEKRRNIFLAVKEALNNVLKHSRASTVIIQIAVDDKLSIQITDNGVGIDMENIRKFGNGLQNMKKRITSISGEFRMENHQGTKTIFELEI